MFGQLRSQIRESAFLAIWEDTAPPYEVFLQEAADRLSKQVPQPVEEMSASIRSGGKNRGRIDGQLKTWSGEKNFYVELVWMPTYQSFRGEASVRDKLPEPEEKSIDGFIAALDAITEENDIILAARAYYAADGVDLESSELRRAFPAFFALFERFPYEDFEGPELLLNLLAEHGGYEGMLIESLTRTPSVAAVNLVEKLFYRSDPPEDPDFWIAALENIVQSEDVIEEVRENARRVLEMLQ